MLRQDFNLTKAILSVWAVVSVLGFLLIGWNYLENAVYDNGVKAGFQEGADAGYQQGLNEGATRTSGQIYNEIINKSGDGQCNTVFVQYEGRRVDLVNVQCLQVQQPDANDAEVPNS